MPPRHRLTRPHHPAPQPTASPGADDADDEARLPGPPAPPSDTPLGTYEIHDNPPYPSRHAQRLVLFYNQPILWADIATESGAETSTTLEIRAQGPQGPVVAAGRRDGGAAGWWMLGDPQEEEASWLPFEAEGGGGWDASHHAFSYEGTRYRWQLASEAGPLRSLWTGKQRVELTGPHPVGVGAGEKWILAKGLFPSYPWSGPGGEVDWFCDLERGLEMAALVVVMLLYETDRKGWRKAAVGGLGGVVLRVAGL